MLRGLEVLMNGKSDARFSGRFGGRCVGRAAWLAVPALAVLLAGAGCGTEPAPDDPPPAPDPLAPFLPPLPPEGGPQTTRAGRLTEANFERERVPGPAAQGRIGDYYLANDVVRVVIQQPGRSIAPLPYGGNPIDLDFVDQPEGDQLGEVGPLLLVGRTVDFGECAVLRDGAAGGAAVVRCRGKDVIDDYIDLRALGAVASLFPAGLQPDLELGLTVAVTYILPPGASALEVVYTFYNAGGRPAYTSWGTLTDAGGNVHTYSPGVGFGAPEIQALITEDFPLTPYAAQQGERLTYGVIPERIRPGVGALVLPITGIAASIYDLVRKQDLFADAGLTVELPPGKGTSRRLRLAVTRGGVDGIERLVRTQIDPEPLRTIRGTLKGTLAGEPVGIGIRRLDLPERAAPYDAYTAVSTLGSDGSTTFTTALPVGRYIAQAQAARGRRLGPQVMFDVTTSDPSGTDAQPLSLEVPEPARLHYRILDESGQPMPGKVSVVGTFFDWNASIAPPRAGGTLPAEVSHSLGGDSRLGTRWDHPLLLAPGTYRVVVSHGPEWSRHEEKVTIAAGAETTVTARLAHVVDTAGYLACDFHQHSVNSPDSLVTLEDRVVTNLAEGLEFLSSADHDSITDYRPIIDALGGRGRMDAVPGDEITPFGYGHFIGWPLPYDRSAPLGTRSPSGGALDWGGGDGFNLTPAQIFDGLRGAGARIVQVNHPREGARTMLAGFQQNFDRAGLRFDFAARTFYGDKDAMPVPALLLGMPEDGEVFSATFDSIEVLNGVDTSPPNASGDRVDLRTESVLRDFMNFLSFGFVPAAVGSSDTHGIVEPVGVPRTLVRVADDSAAALDAGAVDAVLRTLRREGGAPRDVIVTNGPMLTLSAGTGTDRVGIGGTTRPSGGKLHVEAEVRTPEWAPIHTVEIFANSTFTIPDPKSGPEPLLPALCWTSLPMPPPRCAGALVAGTLTVERVALPSGAYVLRARVAADVDVDALLARGAPGAVGKDVWLLARTVGDRSMFPAVSASLPADVPIAKLLDGVPITDGGPFPLAFTNPVFVDVDGGGWRGAFQP